MKQATGTTLGFSGFSVLYARLVNRLVSWLTPKRLKIYPAALLSCVVVSSTWASLSAVASGFPYFLTIGQDFKSFYTGMRFLSERCCPPAHLD